MTASSRPSANRAGAALVVVCCASEDAESLGDALTALRDDGLEVERVEGLDQDPKRLTEVIDRRAGEGLYVLCRSPRLGREQVEELREILLARHIPFARTLTVAVGGRGALADRIRSGLRRASSRTSGPNRASDGGTGGGRSPSVPELVPTSRSRPLRPTNAAEDEEPTLVGKRELEAPDEAEVVPSRPSLPSIPSSPPMVAPEPRTPTPPPPRPSTAAQSATAEHEPAPPREGSATPESSAVEVADEDRLADSSASPSNPAITAPTDLDLSDLDETTGSMKLPRVDTTAVSTPPPLITGNTVVGPAPVMVTGDTVTGEKLPGALREVAGRWPLPSASGGTAPPPPARVEAPEAEPITAPLPHLPPPPTPLPPRTSAPEPSPDASASFSAPAPAGSAAASLATGASRADVEADAVPSRGVLPWVLGAVALLLLALVIALAVTTGDEAAEVASDDEAGDATPAPTVPADEAKTEAGAAPDEPPPGPRVYRVVDALEARKVRALDVLLIATDTTKTDDHAAAASYCSGLEVEGLRGWRLPHIGELSSLSEANMISRGMYWSSTAADTFGDEHMAWNGRRRHAEPHRKNAVAVCVRGGATGS